MLFWIRNNGDRFRDAVFEPMCLLIDVDPRYASALENAVCISILQWPFSFIVRMCGWNVLMLGAESQKLRHPGWSYLS